MTIDFGSVQKYNAERGFGFVKRTLHSKESTQEIFFHIKTIKRKYYELAQKLDNGSYDSVSFWYEVEKTDKGEQVSKLWLSAEDIPSKELDSLTAKIQGLWHDIDAPTPHWLNQITLLLVGQICTDDLIHERERLQRQRKEAEEEERKKRKTERLKRLEAIREKERLEAERRRKKEAERLKYLKYLQEVECAYQGSKVFANGGPFSDLYYVSSKEAKTDERLRNSGNFVGYEFFGENFLINPVTAFYDWLYLTALSQNPSLANKLFDYKGFSDIAFNPKKSFNCQARAAALFVSLCHNDEIDRVVEDKNYYIDLITKNNSNNISSMENQKKSNKSKEQYLQPELPF